MRDLYVYLPPQYDSKQRFPIVMLLAGFGSTNHSIAAWSPWKPNTIQRFDQLVSERQCPPAILVLPDCFNRWGGSQFLDSPGTGLYQTYLADEVIPFVDAGFRTIPDREARAVAGRSSGGFGALRLGMDRPDVVSVIGSHAGDAAFEVSMRPMLTPAAITFEQTGGLDAFAREVPATGPRNASQFDAIFVLAASGAYSPDPEGFPYARLPFEPRTGTLRKDVWRDWLAEDPVSRIDASVEALKTMSLIYLDAGSRDEHGLHFAARMLEEALSAHHLRVHYDEFEGGHRGTSSRYETSLPRMIQALRRE
ncbi:MAG: esterase family protein [Myxococcales bacterium]|nr:esterase family protein [Myxococcales bacterium]